MVTQKELLGGGYIHILGKELVMNYRISFTIRELFSFLDKYFQLRLQNGFSLFVELEKLLPITKTEYIFVYQS